MFKFIERFKTSKKPEQQEQQELNCREKIIEAIKLKNPEDLLDSIAETNKYLVPESSEQFTSDYAIERLRKQIAEFFEEMENSLDVSASSVIYLGDAGLSRLTLYVRPHKKNINSEIPDDKIEVGIVSEVSTEKVKERWNELNEESEE